MEYFKLVKENSIYKLKKISFDDKYDIIDIDNLDIIDDLSDQSIYNISDIDIFKSNCIIKVNSNEEFKKLQNIVVNRLEKFIELSMKNLAYFSSCSIFDKTYNEIIKEYMTVKVNEFYKLSYYCQLFKKKYGTKNLNRLNRFFKLSNDMYKKNSSEKYYILNYYNYMYPDSGKYDIIYNKVLKNQKFIFSEKRNQYFNYKIIFDIIKDYNMYKNREDVDKFVTINIILNLLDHQEIYTLCNKSIENIYPGKTIKKLKNDNNLLSI